MLPGSAAGAGRLGPPEDQSMMVGARNSGTAFNVCNAIDVEGSSQPPAPSPPPSPGRPPLTVSGEKGLMLRPSSR